MKNILEYSFIISYWILMNKIIIYLITIITKLLWRIGRFIKAECQYSIYYEINRKILSNFHISLKVVLKSDKANLPLITDCIYAISYP